MCALSVVALSSFHAPPTHWNHAIMLSSFHCCHFIFFHCCHSSLHCFHLISSLERFGLDFIACARVAWFVSSVRVAPSSQFQVPVSSCSINFKCPCRLTASISSARAISQHQFQVPVPSCIVHFKCQCRLTTSFEVSVSVSLSVSVRSRCEYHPDSSSELTSSLLATSPCTVTLNVRLL